MSYLDGGMKSFLCSNNFLLNWQAVKISDETMVLKNEIKHIAIAGNIGSGKTTMTSLIAKHYKWIPHFEDADDNPYLNDFYEDMPRWAFNLQIYFLNNRFHQILKIRQGKKTVVQDRTIYEDAYIFAPNLYAMGLMSKRDFDNYLSLFQLMEQLIQPPDLIIYLKASVPTLVKQIQKRGREYENGIRLDYLKKLNERYENWAASYNKGKLITFDVDEYNFLENKEDFSKIIKRIDSELSGLFN